MIFAPDLQLPCKIEKKIGSKLVTFFFVFLLNSREVIASTDFCSRPTVSLRGPLQIYEPSAKREFTDGMDGMDGWDGTEYQKCPSIFFIFKYVDN